MADTYVLDAWALLALLQAEEPAATRVRDLLVLGEALEVVLLLSVISLGEVFYCVGKQSGRTQAEQVLGLIRELPVSVAPASDDAVMQAAIIKMQYPLSYADAFAAALAVSSKGTLVSGNRDFEQLSTVLRLERLRRAS